MRKLGLRYRNFFFGHSLTALNFSLTSIRTTKDVARFFGVTPNYLSYLLYSHRRPGYYLFNIPKKSGGFRELSSPPQKILLLQRHLLISLSKLYHAKPPVHGFVSKRSIVSNAKIHVGSKWVLNIDLDNFFPSIHFGRIRGVFQKYPFSFSHSVSTVLAQLCCFNSKLPQGAPTSPIISNLICRGLDQDLFDLSEKFHVKFTRYADDLTFSTNTDFFPPDIGTIDSSNGNIPLIGEPIIRIIKKHGFEINPMKTRITHMREHQQVTGLTVNEKVNVKRNYVRNIRAIIHDIEKNGYSMAESNFHQRYDHKTRANKTHPPLKVFLKGKLDFLKMVKGETDPTYMQYAVKAEKHINSNIFGVLISGPSASNQKLLSASCWLLIGKDANGEDVVQASAFSLKSFGIVSARHVFEKSEASCVSKWVIINVHSKDEFPVKGYLKNDSFDLTLLVCDPKHIASFRASNSDCIIGQDISVIGFPRWHSFGDQVSNYPGKISQIRIISTVSYIETNAHIVEGNSGGPVLNRNGEVIGVAITSRESPTTPSAAISINHLFNIKKDAQRVLFEAT
jgi:RNA-directed DNA polymerase